MCTGVLVAKGRATPTLYVLLSAFPRVHEDRVWGGKRCGEAGNVRVRVSGYFFSAHREPVEREGGHFSVMSGLFGVRN